MPRNCIYICAQNEYVNVSKSFALLSGRGDLRECIWEMFNRTPKLIRRDIQHQPLECMQHLMNMNQKEKVYKIAITNSNCAYTLNIFLSKKSHSVRFFDDQKHLRSENNSHQLGTEITNCKSYLVNTWRSGI